MARFVAVEVPGDVAAGVAGAVTGPRRGAPGLRWMPPARYHLTLHYLGAVPDAAVPPVIGALHAAAGAVRPFELALDGRLGEFGGRVLWAGLSESPPLQHLASVLLDALARVVALPTGDRPLHPHLTLARLAGSGRAGGGRAGGGRAALRRAATGTVLPALRWRVPAVALLRSPPPAPAAPYVREALAPLGGEHGRAGTGRSATGGT